MRLLYFEIHNRCLKRTMSMALSTHVTYYMVYGKAFGIITWPSPRSRGLSLSTTRGRVDQHCRFEPCIFSMDYQIQKKKKKKKKNKFPKKHEGNVDMRGNCRFSWYEWNWWPSLFINIPIIILQGISNWVKNINRKTTVNDTKHIHKDKS
jgi:hypothetical protein